MKNFFVYVSVLVAFALATSCTNPQATVSPISVETGYWQDTLSGHRILIPNGVLKEVFYPTVIKPGSANARTLSASLSLEELVTISKPIVEKYPDLSRNPLRSDHLKRILHDFPDFTGEKSVRENTDVVLRYYNGLIKNELVPALDQARKDKANGKVA